MRFSIRQGVMAALLSLATVLPASAEGLFTDLTGIEASRSASIPPGPFVRRSRDVAIDGDYLTARIAPAGVDNRSNRLELAPPAQPIRIALTSTLTIELHRDDLAEASGGGFIWSGSSKAGDEAGGDLVIRDGRVSGIITVGHRRFRIDPLPTPGAHRIAELNPGAFPGDIVVTAPKPQSRATVAPADMAPDAITEITVLIAYTNRAQAAVGDIVAQANLAVTRANSGFSRSRVNIRYRLVGTELVTGYDEMAVASYERVLRDLTDGRFTGPFRGIHRTRDATYADLVAVLIDRPEYCGIAWLVENPTPADAGAGMSVTTVSCVPNETFTHETGHNMGLRHDRYVEGAYPASKYNFGHVSVEGRFRDIMAYANRCSAAGVQCPRINNFSNPNVNYAGRPTGIPAGTEGAADNARRLNETAAAIAAYRVPPVLPPPNDNFASSRAVGAPAIGGANALRATNRGATREFGEPFAIAGATVWYRFRTSAAGRWIVDTGQSDFDTTLGIYTGRSVDALTRVAENDDSGGPQSRVAFTAPAGTLYYVQVGGKNGATGNLRLRIVAPRPTSSAAMSLAGGAP